jgi:hypothetical protein
MTRSAGLLAIGALVIAIACAPASQQANTGPTDPVTVPPVSGDASTSDAALTELEPATNDPCARGRYCGGSLPPALMAELRAIAGQTRACYDRALKTNPELEGRLAVALRVLEDGRACPAELADDSLNGDNEFERCLVDTFARAYPAPREGCVNTVVPLNFKIRQSDAGTSP